MDVRWNTVTRHVSSNYSGTHWKIPGNQIISLYESKYTIKLFDRLSAGLKRNNMSKKRFLQEKMDLFMEYSYPKPFPTDMFLRLPKGSPDAAYLILGQKGTGVYFCNYNVLRQ